MKSKKSSKKQKNITFFQSFIQHISSLNTSKFFTGVVMLTLNISSKYVTLGLSTSQEEYLKYTLGRQILVFAIIWMGTRDIYIALPGVILFTILMDYLFNDDSMFCCLPESFIDDHKKKDEDDSVSDDDIQKAKAILEKAGTQKEGEQKNIAIDGLYNY